VHPYHEAVLGPLWRDTVRAQRRAGSYSEADGRLPSRAEANLTGPPRQSLDLNPIKNVWFMMKKEMHKNHVTSLDDLKVKLNIHIDDNVVRKCVLSMPKRLKAVLACNDGYTKY
jgi:hypothetical protein